VLYVTTRNSNEFYTEQRALCEQRGPDGGLFVPCGMIRFSDEELLELSNLSVCACMARLLNRQLRSKISGEELCCAIGKQPVRMKSMGNRILIAECFRGPYEDFSRMMLSIGRLITHKGEDLSVISPVLEICARVSVLFGFYGELIRRGYDPLKASFDIALVSGNFYGPLSAWIAREMGLPIDTIVFCCNENNALWNLFARGELRTDRKCVNTFFPEADVVIPDGLESYIRLTCGSAETSRYLDCIRTGRAYCPEQDDLQKMQKGMHCSVVSSSGIINTIPKVLTTGSILLSAGGALAYAGLMNYRAITKDMKYSIVLSEKGPSEDCCGYLQSH